MAARKGIAPPTSPAVTAKRRSVRPWHPFRSKWERDYATYLDYAKAVNAIWDWAYEPDRFDIGVGAKFTPDFRVVVNRGESPEYREVKGYRREAAMVRLKVAAKMYPQHRWVLVTKIQGQWVHTELRSALTRAGG